MLFRGFKMIRILLVDDQKNVLEGLKMRLKLENDLEVVGEAYTGHDAYASALALNPDVIIMDYEMPEMDGIAATHLIHAQLPGVPIIILSIYDDAYTKLRVDLSGAVAFVSKLGALDELLAAIRGFSQHKVE
jgi:two-component system response regulator NreC